MIWKSRNLYFVGHSLYLYYLVRNRYSDSVERNHILWFTASNVAGAYGRLDKGAGRNSDDSKEPEKIGESCVGER